MSGINSAGQVSKGWEHVEHSIRKILTTPLNTRVMRREFGSELPDLVDRPMNGRLMMLLFAATTKSLKPRQIDGHWYGEPRFSLDRIEVIQADVQGRVALKLYGKYLPNGHLGDTTAANDNYNVDVNFSDVAA